MFRVRGFGVSRGRSRRFLGVALTCCVLLQFTAQPASANADGTVEISGTAGHNGLQEGGEPGNGPTGCSVERTGFERVGQITSNITGNRNTYLYDSNGAYDYSPPEVVDEDEAVAGGSFGDDLGFRDVVDGEVELDGVPHVVYEVSGCDGYEPGQVEVVFAPPSAATYIPAAEVTLSRILPVPALEFIPFDEENGWTYVQAPIDFRTDAESLAPVSFVIDSGGPDFVGGVQIRRWLAITAVPRMVIFESGDPLAEETVVECSPEEALAPYVEEVPGACSYQFRNGSSVTDSNFFDAELRVEWDVTFTRNDGPPGVMDVEPTVNEEEVAVAEVKAVTQLPAN